MKARYLLSSAAAAIAASGAVSAHAAGQGPDGPAADSARLGDPASAATATDAAASDATAAAMVGDIIVTAERRSENIQAVPMTVTGITAKSIAQQNITTLDDIIKYTPNVTFGGNGAGQGVIFMRGLSAGVQGQQSSATIATFPNVALYLDDQSMQFPGRNVDIYTVDLDRIEVLEGPQGALFGGGAQAGAIRYITNKPNLETFSGSAEAAYGATAGGGANYYGNFVVNIPLVKDKLALRAVVYADRQGGYITNVASTFTRSNQDLGNTYFNIHPNAANICPNGLPGGGPHDLCTLPGAPQGNNFALAGANSNPTTYQGARFSLKWQVNDDWDVLISQTFQNLDAEGISEEYPVGSDFQPLGPMQITFFSPSFDHDNWQNTAWTVNGKLGPIRALYTGGWTSRHIDQQMDYSNYTRSVGGTYYSCTGGGDGLLGSGPPTCFSPISNWRDIVDNTHLSNEFRFTTPDDWRIRGIAGVYQENFRIYDNMNFNYKTIPSCNPQNLAIAQAGGQPCLANVRPAPGSTMNDPNIRSDATAFGEDTQRGYDQLAFFGSADFDIIPHVLTISAGTRWYQYKEFLVGSQYSTGGSCLNVPNGLCGGNGAGGTVNIDAAHDHVTYSGFKSRANITWRVNQDVMAYFTYSEGFRPGGFNRSVSAVAPGVGGVAQFEKPNSYAPDSLINYEWGIKSEWLDHRLLVNLTGYHMLWQNVQLLFFNPTELGNTTFGINGPDYAINGGEIQFDVRPMEGLTIDGAATYNDATQVTSPCLKGNIPGHPSFGQCITQVMQKGVGLVPFENPFGALGTVPAFSPKFEGSLRARYDWDIGNGYRAYVQGGARYMGSMFNQPATYASGVGVTVPNTTLLRFEMPAYTTVDAAIGVTKDNWNAELYTENLTNSHASTLTNSEQFIISSVPLRPRIIMLKLGASF